MPYQRDFKKRLNIGVIGIGSHTYRNLLPCLNYLPVKLCAICNKSDKLKLKNTSEQYGCNSYQDTSEMYKKESLDGVIICTAASSHKDLAIEAFENKVNVFIEKPPALNSNEINFMINKRKSLICVVGYKKAFMPATDKIIEIIKNKSYGIPDSISAVYPISFPKNSMKVLEENLYTEWLQNSCHPFSLMVATCGDPKFITVIGEEKHAVCVLEFENGCTGTLNMSSLQTPIEEYKFFGNSWTATIDNSNKFTFDRGIPFEYGITESFISEGINYGKLVWEPQNCLATLENKALFIQGIYGELKYFCDCVINKKNSYRGSLEFALSIMKTYEASLKSCGKRIKI